MVSHMVRVRPCCYASVNCVSNVCGSAHSCWLGIIIIMHGLRLLIAVLQCLLNCLHVSIIRHFIKFVCLHLLALYVLPEGVYCCFTRTTLFNNHNFYHDKMHDIVYTIYKFRF